MIRNYLLLILLALILIGSRSRQKIESLSDELTNSIRDVLNASTSPFFTGDKPTDANGGASHGTGSDSAGAVGSGEE